MKKLAWLFLDLAINGIGFTVIYMITGNLLVVAIAVGLVLWNYLDGRVRSSWFK